jgi:uncharacterized protein (TIGR02421 family)
VNSRSQHRKRRKRTAGHPSDADEQYAQIAAAVCERLALNKRVRRNLPGKGRLRIDRQLPFLCIYREPAASDPGTRELVTSEAAYLFASGSDEHHQGLRLLCREISQSMQEHFGAFLFLELWARESTGPGSSGNRHSIPAFEILTPAPDLIPSTLEALQSALSEISIHGIPAKITRESCAAVAPPGLRPLAGYGSDDDTPGACVIGVAVEPIYRDPQAGTLYPMVLHKLRGQLAAALRKAIAEFTGLKKGGRSVHYESLGPSSLVKAARLVDQELCEVSESFDFLLQVTPTNSDESWEQFCDSGRRQVPTFYYRPLPYRPSLLKRRLFDIEVERIEDHTVAHLLWEKQEELDRRISALRDLDTPEFLSSSLQLYGAPDDDLVRLAREILSALPDDVSPPADGDRVPVQGIVSRAREEIDYYRRKLTSFHATVEISDSIASGIMVSQDQLLISSRLSLRPERIEPLLHHEVGTHLLTYFNGRCQLFRQLYAGLAGYEELQEGLAVLAEYLSGGLTPRRLRILAGRVLAAKAMVCGADFAETFSLLHDEYHFAARQAFVATLRVFRGGGLTKDIIYLRGLRDLLRYLAAGHDLEPLYVGKISLQHVPYVQEMRRRGIIAAPSVLPRFWNDQAIRERLDACRGRTVLQLMEPHP